MIKWSETTYGIFNAKRFQDLLGLLTKRETMKKPTKNEVKLPKDFGKMKAGIFAWGPQTYTFKVKKHKDGTWTAKCKEVPGVMTSGRNHHDEMEVDYMCADAVLTAMGIKVVVK